MKGLLFIVEFGIFVLSSFLLTRLRDDGYVGFVINSMFEGYIVKNIFFQEKKSSNAWRFSFVQVCMSIFCNIRSAYLIY